MKTATMPALRVHPELRQAAEEILHPGETLSGFVEDALRRNVELRRAQQSFIERGLASREARNFTFAHVEHADGFASKNIIDALGFNRDQILDSQIVRSQFSDEAIGSCRENQHVTQCAVFFYEGVRVIADSRSNPLSEKLLAQRLAIAVRDTFQQRDVKRTEFRSGRTARLITLFHVDIRRRKCFAVQATTCNQEVTPEDVCIAGQQRVIKVEQREPS